MVDINYIKNNVKEGWAINPNEKIVNAIIRGINRNNGQCPCNNNSVDKYCPCSNYREKGYCCCRLYIKKEQ